MGTIRRRESDGQADLLHRTTLDGFIADPDDSLAWPFAQGGADPEEATRGNPLGYEEFIKGIGAIVMGSTTYPWVLAHERGRWPYELPAWVMTGRDLAAPDGADLRFAAGEVKPVYEAMVEAAGGKDLWVVGGGDLAILECFAREDETEGDGEGFVHRPAVFYRRRFAALGFRQVGSHCWLSLALAEGVTALETAP